MDSPNPQPAAAALNERDRRLHPRYTVQVQIELRQEGNDVPMRLATTDLSRTGCYIDTLNPIPAGSQVHIRLQHENEFFDTDGRVIYVSPGLGMGLSFNQIVPAQQAILDRWLEQYVKANK